MKTQEPYILYHYCSNEAFLSIVKSKSIWLSDMTLSNDTKEGQWVWDKLVEKCKKEGVNDKDIESIKFHMIHNSGRWQYYDNRWHCIGFCLSEEGDLLSQWRGYARDATGVAIGFSEEFLFGLQNEVILDKVKYYGSTVTDNEDFIFQEIIDHIRNGAFEYKTQQDAPEELRGQVSTAIQELMNASGYLASLNFLYKNPAFKEEKEWRLISPESGSKHRTSVDRIIPYSEISLEGGECQPIAEIILGPKNITPEGVIENFLDANGFKGVKVKRSTATFR